MKGLLNMEKFLKALSSEIGLRVIVINLGMIYEAWVSVVGSSLILLIRIFFVEIVSGSNTCKSDQMQNQ